MPQKIIKPRPATKVHFKKQKAFVNDGYISRNAHKLAASGAVWDQAQVQPFVKPEESLWITFGK